MLLIVVLIIKDIILPTGRIYRPMLTDGRKTSYLRMWRYEFVACHINRIAQMLVMHQKHKFRFVFTTYVMNDIISYCI